jgi:hypothetical protein
VSADSVPFVLEALAVLVPTKSPCDVMELESDETL